MTSPVTLILLGQAYFIGSALGFPPIVPNWYEENRGEIQLQLQPDVPPVVQISKRPILESTQNEPEFTAIKRDDDKSTSGIVAHGVDRNAVKLNTAGKISENESDHRVITIKNSDRESKSFARLGKLGSSGRIG
ncbi:uncharacterized protein LOC124175184 [Neodiprion fabricii]|uniref:uncharacterized protein LOC124175184 n=1 Tax=Neodiprion fabricii TaxID=2872261 RepID=UPI001ED93074|nr:uncharacterized protein LOC124175184 [Neodiprion fabricii]